MMTAKQLRRAERAVRRLEHAAKAARDAYDLMDDEAVFRMYSSADGGLKMILARATDDATRSARHARERLDRLAREARA